MPLIRPGASETAFFGKAGLKQLPAFFFWPFHVVPGATHPVYRFFRGEPRAAGCLFAVAGVHPGSGAPKGWRSAPDRCHSALPVVGRAPVVSLTTSYCWPRDRTELRWGPDRGLYSPAAAELRLSCDSFRLASSRALHPGGRPSGSIRVAFRRIYDPNPGCRSGRSCTRSLPFRPRPAHKTTPSASGAMPSMQALHLERCQDWRYTAIR